MLNLIRQLLRACRGTFFVVVLMAMMLATAMSLGAPWALSIIIDNICRRTPASSLGEVT
jgi:ABC-type multidrug transport system fused ATPase/permease subunit